MSETSGDDSLDADDGGRPADGGGGGGRGRRLLATLAVIVTVAGGAVGLTFTFAPSLRPCLGETGASFTGAPVFPGVRFHDHLIRNGVPREEVVLEPNLLGAEIRFSYRTTGYRGARLTITWSLIAIEGDETLGAVVRGQDRALAMTVTPRECTATGGKDLFLQIPRRGKRYRVVLELYRDPALSDRVALTETDPFRG